MDEPTRRFLTDLGRAALARDWPRVHGFLAPWLRAHLSPGDVREFFENEYRTTLRANGHSEMHYPEACEPEVGGNSHTNATALREPIDWQDGRVRDVAIDVTDANMIYWGRVELACSDEQMASLGFDYFAEVWAAVVETPEGLRVGYWSHGAY